jgi:hypothetical protein
MARDRMYINIRNKIMLYNKKLTDLNRSGSTGNYPTSVLLYWPRYRSVGYFPVLPSLSVSKLLVLPR